MKKYFSYFVKPVLVKCTKPSHSLGLQLKQENLLPSDLLFLGGKARKVIGRVRAKHAVVANFLKRVAKAYKQTPF